MENKEKIPKTIHYCWFGGKPMPRSIRKRINGWRKKLTDYTFVEWNEKNFDINSVKYVKEAYNEGKWAFVSDYVRLYALIQSGGIYLDTDVEVLNNFDSFLDDDAFISFESSTSLCTAVIGSKPNNSFFQKILDDYNNESFEFSKDIVPNSVRFFNYVKKCYGIDLSFDNEYKLNGLHIYPRTFFCAKDIHSYQLIVTDKTVTIHHLDASWYDNRKKALHFCKKVLMSFINLFRKDKRQEN